MGLDLLHMLRRRMTTKLMQMRMMVVMWRRLKSAGRVSCHVASRRLIRLMKVMMMMQIVEVRSEVSIARLLRDAAVAVGRRRTRAVDDHVLTETIAAATDCVIACGRARGRAQRTRVRRREIWRRLKFHTNL